MTLAPVVRLAILALLASLSPAAAQQEKPAPAEKPAPPPVPEVDKTVTLTLAKPPPASAKMPVLKLEGTAQVPDHLVLRADIYRIEESYANGTLAPQYIDGGTGLVQVRSKKFTHEPQITSAGTYLFTINYVDDFQPTQITDAVKARYAGKSWKFDLSCWGEDFIKQLGKKLDEVDAFATEGLGLIQKYEKACATEVTWKTEEKALTKETGSYLTRIQRTDAVHYYPATVNQIFFTIRNVQGTSPYFVWKDGKFGGGKSYHADGEEIKTFRQEGFTYENLKRYVSEGSMLAGRELTLWILKEIRRTGAVSDTVKELLKTHGEHVGVAQYAERLKTALPADCAEIEKAVRQK